MLAQGGSQTALAKARPPWDDTTAPGTMVVTPPGWKMVVTCATWLENVVLCCFFLGLLEGFFLRFTAS